MNPVFICKICGKEFESSRGFAYHIKQGHKMTHKYYYDKYLKTENKGKCEKCGSETEFISISKGYNKLCNNCKNTSNQKMICRICGFETSSLGMPSHLTQNHKMTTKEYYDNYLIEGHCRICGKPTKFTGILTGYTKTCSRKCQYEYQKTDEYVQIIQSTNLKKYGVKAGFNTEKARQTMIERYGVENPFQSEEVKEKIKQTFIEHYGTDHNMKSEKGKQELRDSIRQKYGVEYSWQREDVKEKIRQTNLEKYGAENPYASEEIKVKIKKTNIEKYGISIPNQFNNDICKQISDKNKELDSTLSEDDL